MNEEIIKTQNEIIECVKLKKELQEKLIQQYYDYLKTINIEKNCIVKTKNETGIFTKLVNDFGRIKPVIKKIKKDGTPHATATVYCFEIEDMTRL